MGSIHSILGVLLGSTALGSFAPLTALTLERHTIVGSMSGTIIASTGVESDVIGPNIGTHHTTTTVGSAILASQGATAYNLTNSIILGFTGLLISNASQNLTMTEDF